MPTQKLSKRVANAAAPTQRRYSIFDIDIRGFGLRIFPWGEKSWIYEYRGTEGGRRAAKKTGDTWLDEKADS